LRVKEKAACLHLLAELRNPAYYSKVRSSHAYGK
jgi:hypothetical protein